MDVLWSRTKPIDNGSLDNASDDDDNQYSLALALAFPRAPRITSFVYG